MIALVLMLGSAALQTSAEQSRASGTAAIAHSVTLGKSVASQALCMTGYLDVAGLEEVLSFLHVICFAI